MPTLRAIDFETGEIDAEALRAMAEAEEQQRRRYEAACERDRQARLYAREDGS